MKASVTDPAHWGTYAEVSARGSNIGIIFTPDQSLLGIDLDHVLTDGKITHAQKEAIERLLVKADTYTEISTSGDGLHILLRLAAPFTPKTNRKEPFEIYTKGRYFVVTNNPFGPAKPVRTITPEEADELLAVIGYPWKEAPATNIGATSLTPILMDDQELLQKMFSAKNGSKMKALYSGDSSVYGGDISKADFALCLSLAFWTQKDAARMESIWLASPLGGREKTQKRKDYRDSTITAAIQECASVYAPSAPKEKTTKEKHKEKTQAEILLEIIDGLQDTVLFHDEHKNAYIVLNVGGHQEIFECRGGAMQNWLAHEFWKKTEGGTVNAETIKGVVAVLVGRASFDGPMHELSVRSAWQEDILWYDLTDEKWRAVEIDAHGWQIVEKTPILFRRYSHVQSQVTPDKSGNASLFLNYINIKDLQQQLLLMVFLVSCFVPGFPHPILVIFGPQGSAKSTLSKLLRKIIDPSKIEVASMPDTHKELVQTLAHHAFLFFDNVSYISEATSDTLCKAVTGSGFPKRKLYSDDEDIIYSFKRCIGINGINLVSTRSDLLERSLLIGLDRIEPSDRKQEAEIQKNFEHDLPMILGGIFDVLVTAIKLRPGIKIDRIPRMADWTVWGCAIAEALGYKREDFLLAYQANIRSQTEVVLNEHVIAAAMISFMESRIEWSGTPTELLSELTTHAAFRHIDTFDRYWPRVPNILMRRLNELSVNLKEVGITFVSIPGDVREVVIRKVVRDTNGTDDNF